uniref:Uncharacterized protein n=1 Tax=Anguilla anguilla TaxID=7936 RepID=A0A0E9SLK2_ANGAN
MLIKMYQNHFQFSGCVYIGKII